MKSLNEQKELKILMADWYLDIDWSLIPILPEEKRPPHNFGWRYYQSHQPTRAEVHQWINNGWYLAVVTGANLLIIDDDRVKNGLPEWNLTSSVISKSENNGKHYYFTNDDREIHSHVNPELHVDIKGWHSYALVPPFKNRTWISKPSKENLARLTPVPEELVTFINPRPEITISHPPKLFNPKANPTVIQNETWLERVERARQAPLDVHVLPFLYKQSTIYGGISSLCPFHKENSPSFELKFPVGEQTDFHGHCYGCNKHVIGVIRFHMMRTNLDFKNAVRDLTK